MFEPPITQPPILQEHHRCVRKYAATIAPKAPAQRFLKLTKFLNYFFPPKLFNCTNLFLFCTNSFPRPLIASLSLRVHTGRYMYLHKSAQTSSISVAALHVYVFSSLTSLPSLNPHSSLLLPLTILFQQCTKGTS